MTSFTEYPLGLLVLCCGGCLSMLIAPVHGADKAEQDKLLTNFRQEFIEITPGRGEFPAVFTMGTPKGPVWEQPAHEVRFENPFSISRYEVPQNLYEAVMGQNPSRWKGPRNSAEQMTWEEAQEFCRKATALLRARKLIEPDDEIRLPTEAEWEYCCRAGTTSPYSFGERAAKEGDKDNQASILDEYGWHTGNAAGNDPPGGAKRPNAWGLYDMHGYLWEFVADPWRETYATAASKAESTPADAPSRRVVRGGSWKDRYECHRSAFRMPVAASARDDALGFRCVKARHDP